jgi:GT2 family glycosyltransferase
MEAVGPLVSIVIVAFNSKADLERCLPTLATQDVEHEIILVDNCSTDGTFEWLQRSYPQVRVMALGGNLGYAAGNNHGIQAARGRYVLVLNPDTMVHPEAITELVRVAESCPRAFVTAKLIQPDGSLNACGNQMHYTGITTCTGRGQNPVEYRGVRPSFLLSGAAILAPKVAWLDVGAFDEHFFLYMEDADLSLRAQLKGYTLLCAANAVMTHRYSLNMSARKFYYLERNRLLTLVKIYDSRTLRKMALGLFLTELATWAYALFKGRPYLVARWRGYIWLWQHRQIWWQARRQVQATRQISDARLVSQMTESLPYQQLIGWPWVTHVLRQVTTPFYRLARPRWPEHA